MSRWYVCIDHLADEQLGVFGWYRTRENDTYILYERAYGEDPQIVLKAGQKFLYIDDYNDAMKMKSQFIIHAPPDGTAH
jgi:hypothetical protein